MSKHTQGIVHGIHFNFCTELNNVTLCNDIDSVLGRPHYTPVTYIVGER